GVRSSADEESDAARLRAGAGSSDTLTEISPYAFRLPLAPLEAARLEKRRVTLQTIMRAFNTLCQRHEALLVEGVGGVHVPVTSSVNVLDIIYHMRLPALVVGRASLGGLNHALLTLEALRRRKITVLALVLNQTLPAQTETKQLQEGSTLRLLRQLAGVSVIGPLSYRAALEQNFQREVSKLARTATITKLAQSILASGRRTIARRS
ncbi:MAG: dethiobiotin synthase, partial [Nitrospiraceae bacterium]